MLIDTHAHIYLHHFDDDRRATIERAFAAGVEIIIMPAIDLESIELALALCDEYDGLYAMAAIHPSETKETPLESLDQIREYLSDPRVVAVGESGLDYYWDRSFDERQHAFLRAQAELAIEAGLPLVLHNREAGDDLLTILEEVAEATAAPQSLKGVLHCFGGPVELGERALRLGFYLGLGGTLTFKNSGVADVVQHVPLDRLILETDSPYLAPVPHRGRRNEPAHVVHVAHKLAEVKGLSVDEIEISTSDNAKRVFGL